MAKGAQKMNKTSVNDILEKFEEVDLETSDKLYMFVQMCNAGVLIQHLQKQAMMLKMDMVPEDPVYTFAYAVLKLASPHLFEGEEG